MTNRLFHPLLWRVSQSVLGIKGKYTASRPLTPKTAWDMGQTRGMKYTAASAASIYPANSSHVNSCGYPDVNDSSSH